MIQQLRNRRDTDGGFTLVELLITIVIIGILATVVVLSIGGLTNSGESSACKATADAADVAATAYYADHAAVWPANFSTASAVAPTNALSDYLTLKGDASYDVANALLVHGNGWDMTMHAATANAGPTFTCANV